MGTAGPALPLPPPQPVRLPAGQVVRWFQLGHPLRKCSGQAGLWGCPRPVGTVRLRARGGDPASRLPPQRGLKAWLELGVLLRAGLRRVVFLSSLLLFYIGAGPLCPPEAPDSSPVRPRLPDPPCHKFKLSLQPEWNQAVSLPGQRGRVPPSHSQFGSVPSISDSLLVDTGASSPQDTGEP